MIIAAPASGQGKTSVTAALACFYRLQGKQVRVFKIGPDFLDPMILEQASGHPVYQVDLWMVGEAHSRQLLHTASLTADIIIIEGVMGLFDGAPSTADFASQLRIPVLAVIDSSAMAQTFGAIVHGLATYRNDIDVKGCIANRVGSERHYQMIKDALPSNINCYGALPRQKEALLPSRHLGLFQAKEIDDIQQRITNLAEQLLIDNNDIQFPLSEFKCPQPLPSAKLLTGVCIAVARDLAFSFIYQANLDLLQDMGAELVFFSPLKDTCIPPADSLYLPGGYPELHLKKLSNNTSMCESIRSHFSASKPILAECGGMLYITDSLTDKQGETANMIGLLTGKAKLQSRLTVLALQYVTLNNEQLRGHSYHHSLFESDEQPLIRATCPNSSPHNEAIYQKKRLTASYIHFYFPSNPTAIANFFKP